MTASQVFEALKLLVQPTRLRRLLRLETARTEIGVGPEGELVFSGESGAELVVRGEDTVVTFDDFTLTGNMHIEGSVKFPDTHVDLETGTVWMGTPETVHHIDLSKLLLDRIWEHCPSCGAAETLGLGICSCPCHYWPGRRCGCGGIVEFINYTITDGELTVHEAQCRDCEGWWNNG